MALHQKIAYYRKKAGLSQRELAGRAGVSSGAIGQYETNRKTPRIETLRRLALDKLQVTERLLEIGEDNQIDAGKEDDYNEIALEVQKLIQSAMELNQA